MGNEDTAGQPGERYKGEYRDIWDDHNHRQEFEHDLINRKTTWSLTTQTLLFTAYGLVLKADISNGGSELRHIIAGTGLGMAILLLIGILTLIRSKYLSWESYRDFFDSSPSRLPRPLKQLDWGVSTPNTKVTLTPDALMPVIFAAAWMALLIIDPH